MTPMPPEIAPPLGGREESSVMPDDHLQPKEDGDERSSSPRKQQQPADSEYYLENLWAIVFFTIGSSFLLGVSISDMIGMEYTAQGLRFLAPVFYLCSGLNLVIISNSPKELYSATTFALASLADSISVIAGLEKDSKVEEIFLLFASHLYLLYGVWTLCWRRNRYRQLTLRKTAIAADVLFLIGAIINFGISYAILGDLQVSSQETRNCGFAAAVFWYLNSMMTVAVYGVERFLGPKISSSAEFEHSKEVTTHIV